MPDVSAENKAVLTSWWVQPKALIKPMAFK
jgi:hypothetical protein